MSNALRALLLSSALITIAGPSLASPQLLDVIEVAGDAADASGDAAGANGNRLSFGSDLFFDGTFFWGLADRGPGGGVIPYETRVHKMAVDFNTTTGRINGLTVAQTIKFKDQNGNAFNGLAPSQDDVLGNSFDPEGFAVRSNGNLLVSDEYGPSVYEFDASGTFIRAFDIPDNIVPIDNGVLDFNAGSPDSGRQGNRGFEGVTISPDGTKVYAMLQDPLQEEGSPNGRSSQNLRIVEFDMTTGSSTAQFIYQLESVASINTRTDDDFSQGQQGRNIGISAIVAISDTEFLVLERDNRGPGVDPTTSALDVGSKRVFKIDIAGATDVSLISLAGTNALGSVVPVEKKLFLDIQALLEAKGFPVPEKIEGLTFGPALADGRPTIFLATDNDFSVTQDGTNLQDNVCVSATAPLDGVTGRVEVAIGEVCPAGTRLIPSFLIALTPVPEPSALALLGLGVGLAGFARARRAHL